jgi:hypothetical protein
MIALRGWLGSWAAYRLALLDGSFTPTTRRAQES